MNDHPTCPVHKQHIVVYIHVLVQFNS